MFSRTVSKAAANNSGTPPSDPDRAWLSAAKKHTAFNWFSQTSHDVQKRRLTTARVSYKEMNSPFEIEINVLERDISAAIWQWECLVNMRLQQIQT